MTTEQKQSIIVAAQGYMADNNLSARQLSSHSGVSEAYLSAMLNGRITYKSGDTETEISDKWFISLATSIGFTTKKSYWPFVETKEFVKIIDKLSEAKRDSSAAMVICDTGKGKTYAVDKFVVGHPEATIKVTVNNLMALHDVIAAVMERLKLPVKGSKAMRLANIIIALRDMKRRGLNPILIIDEAENMTQTMLAMMKGLYDGVKDYASLTLIGTPKLLSKLDALERRDADGIPQFRRRFKAGTTVVTPGSHPFKPFYDKLGIADKGLQRLLTSICNNYGELNNYLEPVLRAADQNGQPVTEDFFRLYHDMPN
jgi:DNA transposition AAA+ family ATPase